MNKRAVYTMFLMLVAALESGETKAVSITIPDMFTTQLVAAINARDLNAIRSIAHPKTLACMTPSTHDYYAWWLWKDGSPRYTIAADYQVELEKPLNVRALEAGIAQSAIVPAHWPVAPDTGFIISYHPAPMSIMSRLFEVGLEKGHATLIMDCPTALGIEKFHAAREAYLRQQKKLKTLWRSLTPQDQQALSMLARQGMKLDGIKIAEQKYHLDTNEGLALMDMIQYADNP